MTFCCSCAPQTLLCCARSPARKQCLAFRHAHRPRFEGMQLALRRRLRLPFPLTYRQCGDGIGHGCGAAVDAFGDHNAACTRAGDLVRRVVVFEPTPSMAHSPTPGGTMGRPSRLPACPTSFEPDAGQPYRQSLLHALAPTIQISNCFPCLQKEFLRAPSPNCPEACSGRHKNRRRNPSNSLNV